jgi:hypothetical protein
VFTVWRFRYPATALPALPPTDRREGFMIETSEQIFVSSVPFDCERIHAAAIYCSDGRFGNQMDEFLQQGLGLPRYDRLALPGGCACMAGHIRAVREGGAVNRQLDFLVTAHELQHVVLIAHHDCAFYGLVPLHGKPLEQQQLEDLRCAADQIRSAYPGIEVSGFFARKVQGTVQFEPVPI